MKTITFDARPLEHEPISTTPAAISFGHNQARLRDERAWLACQQQRPARFPARRDRKGDQFEKRLAKFADRARDAHDARQRAQDLLDRYRTASK